MSNSIVNVNCLDFSQSPFDVIRKVDGSGKEYWSARDLMPVLGYTKWQNFKVVIENAQENIETVAQSTVEHFLPLEVKNTFSNGSRGRGRSGIDYKLSRLACYHVALCCDSRGNDSVKLAKHYFAVKAREAEVKLPVLNKENEALRLMLELERERNKGKQLDSTMLTLHGDRIVLALRGKDDVIVEKETIITEVVNPSEGTSTKILSADQLKRAVKDRTGQRLKTAKEFTENLRKKGRDDLLVPVTRSQTCEYVAPDKLEEAIAVVFGNCRQKLIGE